MFDYSGVLFPEGSLSSDQTLLFDHSQIVRVDHLGLQDDEEASFKVKLNDLVKKVNAGEGAPAAPAAPAAPMPPEPPVE